MNQLIKIMKQFDERKNIVIAALGRREIDSEQAKEILAVFINAMLKDIKEVL